MSAMETMKPAVQQKTKEVEEIGALISQYKNFGVADLQKVRAAQLQELKKKLKKDVYMKVVKNTIIKRALVQVKNKQGIEKIDPHLAGSNIIILTNLNPFKLALLLEKSKVKISAKAGDKAAQDVIVSAGNTGMPPGPIISQLGAVGLATRIESGSVWINKDTVVAKKGDVINERLASVLSKLGIKPVEAGLAIKAMYDDGVILTQEQLRLDLDVTRKDIETAYSYAFNLAIAAAYPTLTTTPPLLQKAHTDAYKLSIYAGIPTKETIKDIVRKAYQEMASLSVAIAKKDPNAAPKLAG